MRVSGESQLLNARRNPKEARKILKELFPHTRSRNPALTILADAVHTAARVAPAS